MKELKTLDDKIKRTQELIDCWIESWGEDGVYVAFSGGKDSTVLLDIVRKSYPGVIGVFNDTGLELPEIKKFVKETDNIVTIRPKTPFHKVIEKYGWPVISKAQSEYIDNYRNTKSEKLKDKRWNGFIGRNGRTKNYKISEKWKFMVNAPFKISDKCCAKLKKDPAKQFEKDTEKKVILGIMGSESYSRSVMPKCNIYDSKRPISKPILHWNEDDIWAYIKKYNIKYCSAYDKGWKRTGCIFCMYGVQREDKNCNRFHLLKEHHPKLYDYCINKLGAGKVMDYMNINY